MAEKRGSLFTVRDAESAIITYTALGILYIIGICLYELVAGWNGVLQVIVKLDATSPAFNRTAVEGLTITHKFVPVGLNRNLLENPHKKMFNYPCLLVKLGFAILSGDRISENSEL